MEIDQSYAAAAMPTQVIVKSIILEHYTMHYNNAISYSIGSLFIHNGPLL